MATNTKCRSRQMLIELKSVIERSSATLVGDFIGAVALILMLIVGLYLPSFT